MSKVKYMNNAFKDCSSLISLPDISKWDISNVNEMNYLFKNCSSLISLPDISKWDISEKNYDIFEGCFNLLIIPKKFTK